ncbi:MAG: energy transducer TonB [Bacteroidota bacterium]|mgnify:CR=1 FL=1
MYQEPKKNQFAEGVAGAPYTQVMYQEAKKNQRLEGVTGTLYTQVMDQEAKKNLQPEETVSASSTPIQRTLQTLGNPPYVKGMYREAKKSPQVDLNRIRPLLFGIGLNVSLLLVILAFDWKSSDQVGEANQLRITDQSEEILEIPPTNIPPPPPPSAQISGIIEVADSKLIKDEVKVNIDMEITEQTATQEIIYEAPPAVEESEVAEEIFLFVEEPAGPRDGMAAFYKYLGENIRYPALARRLRVDGKVFVEFVVERDGSLNQFNVVKGIGSGCDEEAVRVLQDAPRWFPGKQRGRPVRQKMVLPIHFVMAD